MSCIYDYFFNSTPASSQEEGIRSSTKQEQLDQLLTESANKVGQEKIQTFGKAIQLKKEALLEDYTLSLLKMGSWKNVFRAVQHFFGISPLNALQKKLFDKTQEQLKTSLQQLTSDVFTAKTDLEKIAVLSESISLRDLVRVEDYTFNPLKMDSWKNVFRAVQHFFSSSSVDQLHQEMIERVKEWSVQENQEPIVLVEQLKNEENGQPCDSILSLIRNGGINLQHIERFSSRNNAHLAPLAGFMSYERLKDYFDFPLQESVKSSVLKKAWEAENYEFLIAWFKDSSEEVQCAFLNEISDEQLAAFIQQSPQDVVDHSLFKNDREFAERIFGNEKLEEILLSLAERAPTACSQFVTRSLQISGTTYYDYPRNKVVQLFSGSTLAFRQEFVQKLEASEEGEQAKIDIGQHCNLSTVGQSQG